MHLLGPCRWARTKRAQCGLARVQDRSAGLGAAGAGKRPRSCSPAGGGSRLHSPTLGIGAGAAGALPSRGVHSYSSRIRSRLVEAACADRC